MPLQVPVLDDRNFEQLLEEAKRRIPVYTGDEHETCKIPDEDSTWLDS